MEMELNTDKLGFSWLIGGAQGTGIERGASIFIYTIASAGYYVFGKREYYSNIMGEHSYFYVRIDNKPVYSHIERFHLLASYDAETVFKHSLEGIEGGAIIYNVAFSNTKVTDIPTIEERLKHDIIQRLKSKNLGITLNDVLKECLERNIMSIPINYNEILNKVANKTGEKLGELTRLNNVIAVSASLALLGIDINLLNKNIERAFKYRKKIVEPNIFAAEYTYDYIDSLGYRNKFKHSLPSPTNYNSKRIIINGNQAIALGKLIAGCRFQTYYPITPATDESSFLEEHENIDIQDVNETFNEEKRILKNAHSIVVIETEDEIAAITMATGAALAGARASTSTSGPGLSLMVEGLGWAGINEVPIVITHYQRGGPSTGMPTRTEQGDLRFVIHAGHGEFPRIVLAPGDIEECFYDTVKAFNYAEKYQLPVILLADRFLANSIITNEVFNQKKLKIDRGLILTEKDILKLKQQNLKYKRFEFNENGISPRIFIGTKGVVFWNTGDEHDELGHITEDPVIRNKMMEKRAKKLELVLNDLSFEEKVNYFNNNSNEFIIVSWGSTKGIILDMLKLLQSEDINLDFLQIKLLHPFPVKDVYKIISNKKIITIENNYSGQLASLIKENTLLKPSYEIVKYNGRQISLDELYIAVKRIINNSAPYRQVLTNGA